MSVEAVEGGCRSESQNRITSDRREVTVKAPSSLLRIQKGLVEPFLGISDGPHLALEK